MIPRIFVGFGYHRGHSRYGQASRGFIDVSVQVKQLLPIEKVREHFYYVFLRVQRFVYGVDVTLALKSMEFGICWALSSS